MGRAPGRDGLLFGATGRRLVLVGRTLRTIGAPRD